MGLQPQVGRIFFLCARTRLEISLGITQRNIKATSKATRLINQVFEIEGELISA
jgi:hypothetical protein